MDLSPESLSRQIQSALKSGDKTTVSVLRLLLTSIKNAQVQKMGELSEDEALAVVAREVRKRDEAAAEFRKAGRDERADAEQAEAAILKQWLPEQIDEAELDRIIATVIDELGASSPSDMGKVMSQVMARVKGRADGRVVSEKVKASLV